MAQSLAQIYLHIILLSVEQPITCIYCVRCPKPKPTPKSSGNPNAIHRNGSKQKIRDYPIFIGKMDNVGIINDGTILGGPHQHLDATLLDVLTPVVDVASRSQTVTSSTLGVPRRCTC